MPVDTPARVVDGSGPGDMRERTGDTFASSDQAQAVRVAKTDDRGGTPNGEWLIGLGTEQKKRDQVFVAERFHTWIDPGGRVDRGIVPGTPGHGQPHDGGQVGQDVAAGLALQEGAVRGFADLLGQSDHGQSMMGQPRRNATQPLTKAKAARHKKGARFAPGASRGVKQVLA